MSAFEHVQDPAEIKVCESSKHKELVYVRTQQIIKKGSFLNRRDDACVGWSEAKPFPRFPSL